MQRKCCVQGAHYFNKRGNMKKKLVVIISAVLLSIAIVALILLFPYIRLQNFANDLRNEQYSFGCSYYFELKNIEKSFAGKVEGYKDTQTIYGKVYYENDMITEIYANDETCLINVSALMGDNVLDLFIKDAYISLEQCSEILDVDIDSIINEVLNCEYTVKSVSKSPTLKILGADNKIKNRYKISTDSILEDFYILLGADEEENAVCNVIIEKEEMYWELSFVCDIGEVEEIYMPKKTLSSMELYLLKQILNTLIRQLYEYLKKC